MLADEGGQQLMGAEPQVVARRRVHLVTVTAGGQDRVVDRAAAQRAVGQFGGERGVPTTGPSRTRSVSRAGSSRLA